MARRDPFRRMMDRMEQLLQTEFGDVVREADAARPMPVDIRQDEDTVSVVADLPGVEEDQIDVRVTADQVTIDAADIEEVAQEEKDYYRHERRQRRFHRTVKLPARIDPDTAEATYDSGVLTVTADKTGPTEGRRVDVS